MSTFDGYHSMKQLSLYSVRRSLRHYFWDAYLNGVAGSSLIPMPGRWILYRLAGMKLSTMKIRSGCRFTSSAIVIGKNSFINHDCCFDGNVMIGEGCEIAMNVTFCGTSHLIGPKTHRAGRSIEGLIRVGDGVWIGANATILPGVTIESGVVIGAGAVVTRNCSADCLYLGNPAIKSRVLSNE